MALVLDTGPLYALLDRSDKDHARCRALIEEARERLVVPAPVLPEVDYLTATRMGTGPIMALLDDISRGAFTVDDLEIRDYARVREVVDRYADQDVGFVDASVLAVVERLEEPKLATLDHRHFSVLRPRHISALRLLPD
ncbi:MAG: PIN domain-containing protein [Actinomycetota bacterium]|nr:PIN domain-containing protein [Actinomycetota bacterium]